MGSNNDSNIASKISQWQGNYVPVTPTTFTTIDIYAIRTTLASINSIISLWIGIRRRAYQDITRILNECTVDYQFQFGQARVDARTRIHQEAQTGDGAWTAETVAAFEKTDDDLHEVMPYACAAEAMLHVGLRLRTNLMISEHSFTTVLSPDDKDQQSCAKMINDIVLPWIDSQGEDAFVAPTIVSGIENMVDEIKDQLKSRSIDYCKSHGHWPGESPMGCGVCLVDAVANNIWLNRTLSPNGPTGAPIMPLSHLMATERFQTYFPHGYTTAPTPDNGLLSGFHAIIYSMLAMYPNLRQPTVAELQNVALYSVEYGIYLTSFGLNNVPHTHVDQLGFILFLWGRHQGLNMQLGYVVDGDIDPLLLPARTHPRTIIVWIHNDNVARETNNLINHFSGIRRNQAPVTPAPAPMPAVVQPRQVGVIGQPLSAAAKTALIASLPTRPVTAVGPPGMRYLCPVLGCTGFRQYTADMRRHVRQHGGQHVNWGTLPADWAESGPFTQAEFIRIHPQINPTRFNFRSQRDMMAAPLPSASNSAAGGGATVVAAPAAGIVSSAAVGAAGTNAGPSTIGSDDAAVDVEASDEDSDDYLDMEDTPYQA